MIVTSLLGSAACFVPERDPAALGFDAALGGFEDSDDAQARFATGERLLAFADAFGKVVDELREGFDLRNVGRPDVAGAVADEHAAPGVDVAVDGDAAVVDFDVSRSGRGRRRRCSAGCRR